MILRIIKVIFYLHRLIYRYPCRSEVRLKLENKKQSFSYNLTYSACVLYICNESLEEIADWLGIEKDAVKEVLNKSVED